MSKNPVSLKEFAHFVEDKAEIIEETKALLVAKAAVDDMYKLLPVSYTHLTLPTILRV